MQAQQHPDDRAVGVGVPAAVQRAEFENAHDVEGDAECQTDHQPEFAGRVLVLGGALGAAGSDRGSRAGSRVLTCPGAGRAAARRAATAAPSNADRNSCVSASANTVPSIAIEPERAPPHEAAVAERVARADRGRRARRGFMPAHARASRAGAAAFGRRFRLGTFRPGAFGQNQPISAIATGIAPHDHRPGREDRADEQSRSSRAPPKKRPDRRVRESRSRWSGAASQHGA